MQDYLYVFPGVKINNIKYFGQYDLIFILWINNDSDESRKKGTQEKRDLEKRGPRKKGPTVFGKGGKRGPVFFLIFVYALRFINIM